MNRYLPTDPDWVLRWPTLVDDFDWLREMQRCPQDPRWHAEGDVGLHTHMVLKALIGSPRFRQAQPGDREVMFWSALLHDVGKPKVTKTESDGSISSRGHSRLGASMAREILWHLGLPIAAREEVCAIVAQHQLPFFLIEKHDSDRRLITSSISARPSLVATVAEADARGRICGAQDRQRMLDNVELYRQLAIDLDCLYEPYAFASARGRFEYLRTPERCADYLPHEGEEFEVVLMAGLPGAGKDTWVKGNAHDLEVISLDRVREQQNVAPDDDQGPVVAQARARAKELLRAKRGFVWNATNVSRQMREQLVNLFTAYGARTRIVYCETDRKSLFARNRSRANPVPGRVIGRLVRRWSVPSPGEAHRVDIIVS